MKKLCFICILFFLSNPLLRAQDVSANQSNDTSKVVKKSNFEIAGIDGVLGKDDWGVYFRMTEAF